MSADDSVWDLAGDGSKISMGTLMNITLRAEDVCTELSPLGEEFDDHLRMVLQNIPPAERGIWEVDVIDLALAWVQYTIYKTTGWEASCEFRRKVKECAVVALDDRYEAHPYVQKHDSLAYLDEGMKRLGLSIKKSWHDRIALPELYYNFEHSGLWDIEPD